jgi:predicted GNAT superfamily acetyltransferase
VTPAVGPGSYTIRDVARWEELQEVLAIQERTWGPDFAEIVPAAILWVATRTGGVVAAAFDGDGAMAGFVFGLSGFRDGRPVHWSDMLAVLPEARSAGLGRRLKQHQRRVLLERGIRDVFWTFDPLESRNAHLNFSRLGAIATEYVPDCYGSSASPLHAGLATDRLVAHWILDSPRVRDRMEDAEDAGATAVAGPATPLNVAHEVAAVPAVNDGAGDVRLDLEADIVRICIPADIQRLKRQDPEEARRWRAATRAAFQEYLARGYVVADLVREGAERSSYLLVAPGPPAEAALSA